MIHEIGIALGYFQLPWRAVRVIFIPKPVLMLSKRNPFILPDLFSFVNIGEAGGQI
jgi:hypothetical protein